jgi:hypothetical protein
MQPKIAYLVDENTAVADALDAALAAQEQEQPQSARRDSDMSEPMTKTELSGYKVAAEQGCAIVLDPGDVSRLLALVAATEAEVARLTAEVARLRGPVTTYKRGYGPGDGDSAALAAVSIGENDD